MENASRALMMAGGILIALMIVGALMLMFNNLSSYQDQNDITKEQAQVVEFNNQYLSYEKNDLTLMEMKSLHNKITSNNTKNPNRYIDGLNNIEETVKSACRADATWKDITGNFNNFAEQEKINLRFSCKIVEYDDKGYIKKIQCENKTPQKYYETRVEI